MQDGIGAALHRFSAHLSGRRTQQGEQLERLASNVLMGQARWLALEVPGRARLRDRLVRTSLILAPELQPEALSELIGALDHLCWLLVASDRQLRPLRTPNHVSCSLPIPKSTISSIHLLIFTKG